MSEQVERSVLSLALKPCASAPTEPGTNRMLARNALALLLDGPATATHCQERFSKRQQHHAGLQLLDRAAQPRQHSARLQCLSRGRMSGIVGTILYFSRDFSFSSAACPPANVTYNQTIQIVTAYINARPQRIQERFIDLATEALHDAWPCKPNLR